MNSYLYPTHPCNNWIEEARKKWKDERKKYFVLWFLHVRPKQLDKREKDGSPFWLYIYYSRTKICSSWYEYMRR